ncbi:MAG: MCE family protein, partial [Bacteroidia bacterium]
RIISADLLGSKAIELVMKDTLVYAESGDTLLPDIKATLTDELNKTVEPLKARAISIFAQLDSVMGDIRHIVNKENRDNLSKSVASLKSTLANLESATGGLDTLVTEEKDKLAKIFDNLESITGNIKNNNDKIQNILTNFSALSDTLAKSNFKSAIQSADKALTEAADIFNKINNGEGSIGMLVNNDSLYNNLNNASKNLDNLFIDIKEHPGRYVTISVFGSKEKKANK